LSDDNSTGILFAALNRGSSDSTQPHAIAGVSEAVQQLMSEFEKADRAVLAARSASERVRLNEKRADALEKLISAVDGGEGKANWIRQYADTVSAAVQEGDFPRGLNRLDAMYKKLAATRENRAMAGYVRFRFLSADYSKSLNEPDADYAKVQDAWLKSLGEFVKQYPTSDDAADAMLQLALAEEFVGQENKAKTWYSRIIHDFPKSPLAKKAAGAQKRLDSVGKSIELSGRSVTGSTVDLADYRGKVVVVHYWSTWCEPCKEEFTVLKNLYAKYSAQGLRFVGVSLDSDQKKLTDYLRDNRLPWPQLHEEGGLDSRYANELGILTLPTMFLIDSSGKVVRRNIHAGELDTELRKLLR
jgi:thiol-disulfide isomerase/thioredoxin